MSSAVPRSQRVQRGCLCDADDLPPNVLAAAQAAADRYGWALIRGSYYRGNAADDSDLDLGIPVPRGECTEWIENQFSEHGVRLDLGYIGAPDNAPGLLIEGNRV